MLRRAFRAMGTDAVLLLDAPPGERSARALDRAVAEIERLEQVMSRFRPGSELSMLNREGRLDPASPDLVRVVERALAAREATDGLFDPTVHDAVVAAGYDRSFEALTEDGDDDRDRMSRSECGGAVRVEGSTIALGPGVRLDLGGIGKGYAADRAAEVLAVAGPCLVDLGGDIAVRGGAWPIGVGEGLTLELTGGGIATSGRDRRRWRRSGEDRHHLIDPATGRPAEDAPLRVTVVAGSATEAEVAAKALFLGAETSLPHVVTGADGALRLTGALA